MGLFERRDAFSGRLMSVHQVVANAVIDGILISEYYAAATCLLVRPSVPPLWVHPLLHCRGAF
jgi:hypothetical protein